MAAVPSPLSQLSHVLLASSVAVTAFLFCDGSLFGFHPTAAVTAFLLLMGEGVLLLHSSPAAKVRERFDLATMLE